MSMILMMMMMMRNPTMIKPIANLFLFLIPLTITYAVVSDLGKPGNHYGSPSAVGVSYSGLPQPHAN
jgi:hypothetical protein